MDRLRVAIKMQNIQPKIVSNFYISSNVQLYSNLEKINYLTTFAIIFSANEVTCDEEDNHISYHPDKNDCTMYYMCEGERKHHMPCPVNLVFNPNENVCDWPENVEGCLHHTQAPPV